MSRDDDVFDDGEIHWGGDHESRYSWESSDEGSSGNDNRDVFDDGKIRWGGDHD